MEQAIGTRIGASSWRGTEPSSSGGLLDCFVVPPRNDGKVGSSCLLDCFVESPRRNSSPAPSLRSEAEAIQKTRSSVNRKKETLMERNRGTILVLDCFVVPPRNDGSRSFGESPLNDGAIVYSARALQRSVTGKLIVYSDVCSSAGGSARMLKGETTQGYILLPNPNHGQFELRQLVYNSSPVKIEVLDILGRTIFSRNRVFQSGRTNIELGMVIPGLYCLTIRDRNTITTIKFVVQ